MKKLRCKTNDCSGADLVAVARKSGFLIFEGARHSKVKTSRGELVTVIPRHSRVKRYLAKGILEDLNRFGANIDIY
jgi:hypothetical protein